MDLSAVPPLLPIASLQTEGNGIPGAPCTGSPPLVATARPSQRPSEEATPQTPGEVYPEACRVGQAPEPPLLFEFVESFNALVSRARFTPANPEAFDKDVGETTGVLAIKGKQKPESVAATCENVVGELENQASPNSGISRNMVSRGFPQDSHLQGDDPTPNLGLAGQVEVNQVV